MWGGGAEKNSLSATIAPIGSLKNSPQVALDVTNKDGGSSIEEDCEQSKKYLKSLRISLDTQLTRGVG